MRGEKTCQGGQTKQTRWSGKKHITRFGGSYSTENGCERRKSIEGEKKRARFRAGKRVCWGGTLKRNSKREGGVSSTSVEMGRSGEEAGNDVGQSRVSFRDGEIFCGGDSQKNPKGKEIIGWKNPPSVGVGEVP